MKRFIFCIQFLFLAILAYATGQTSDIIYIDGARWELLGRPVGADSVLYHDLRAVLPSNRSINTANWDGFIGCWSIRHDVLYLDSVLCHKYDHDAQKEVGFSIPTDTLINVFKKHVTEEGIKADWFTGDIRVAQGKMIYYEHMGFARNYEEEQTISIDKGRVIGTKVFHNYVIDGFSFEKIRTGKELRELFPINLEQYPELADAQRIVFRIRKAQVDLQGNLVKCEVEVVKPADNPRLAAEMAELLKAYRPWKVTFINGEFRAVGIAGYSLPYPLDE